MVQRAQRARAPKLGYHLRARPHKGENLAHCRHWQIVYEIPADGRQQSYEAYEGTKAEAHAHAQRLLGDRRTGKQTTAPPPLVRTFADVAEEWVGQHLSHLEPKTLATHSYVLRHYVYPRLGDIPVDSLLPSHIRDLCATLLQSGGKDGRPLAPRTVTLARGLVSQVMNHHLGDNLGAVNPVSRVKAPGNRRTKPAVWFTPDEMWRLLQAAAGHRLQSFWFTSWATGARPEEVLGLHWDDIDATARTIRFTWAVKEVDGRLMDGGLKRLSSLRTLYFPDPDDEAAVLGFDLLQELAAHRSRQQKETEAAGDAYSSLGLVFGTELGTPLRWSNMRRLFASIRDKAKVPAHPPYAIRHSCASHMLQAGVPLHEVSEWLGHGGIAITKDVYGHLSAETKRTAAATMARFVTRREHAQEA